MGVEKKRSLVNHLSLNIFAQKKKFRFSLLVWWEIGDVESRNALDMGRSRVMKNLK